MHVPTDPPSTCPACGAPYESVSRHADGFVVNLLDNERYRRVCFDPASEAETPALDCYHHTHAQTDVSVDGEVGGETGDEAGGR
ncbi:hypothetical protein [Halorubrum sp. HHNYT27]|uniref:hypothetical protein n=1 Tax=Halorubrum sp. HHNYT27 TaxID=3402275 RepID=UPI003EBB3E32